MADLITLSAGGDFFVLTRRDDGRWRRQADVAFAMVEDGGSPFVAPMTVAVDGEQVELADVGTILHGTEFARCQCSEPATELVDAEFCTRCGSVIR